ncbi:hypothetical protein CYMTET_25200 [Cymbomonas tetramitiformis]|uniref:Uncharacterized protein n=1 Tax=Cymbomonas tetramitiformis TaxID=36881 RepID=A0AAE0FUL3_9CHLO|nr:hypothetical protein CYMTET_25200 [Cymbomonas tetramitiformis]
MSKNKGGRATFARPVLKLSHYPPCGAGGIDLSLSKGGKQEFEARVSSILEKYPSIGKGSGLTDKVVLVGDQNVGKTCLVLRYCENTFAENYKATIGVDFMWQRFLIQGVGFTLHIWDTAGQEKFRSLSQAYYRGARACIAAFDLGVPESFEHCDQWAKEVIAENQAAHDSSEFCVFLVGCKADSFKVVDREAAEALANKLNAEYFEVSSKTEDNVKDLFERIAVVLFERAATRAAQAMGRADTTNSYRLTKKVVLGEQKDVDAMSCCT